MRICPTAGSAQNVARTGKTLNTGYDRSLAVFLLLLDDESLTLLFYRFQPRHFRARQKSTDIRRMSISSDALDNKDNIKTEQMEVVKIISFSTLLVLLRC